MNPNTEILAKVVLDPRRSLKHTDEKNNPLYPVKLRITFLRQRRYYDIGIDPLSAKDFEKIESGNRNTKSLRDIYKDIIKAENEANEIISKLEPFSFNEFKRLLNGPVPTTYSSFHKAFQEYIKELRKQGRIGTANSYNNALTSLISFKKSIHWNDLTPNFLNDYEKSMISKKRTQNTIGIYMRSLRAVINYGINTGQMEQAQYPFGKRSHGKYQIPSSSNIKKALSKEEIDLIKEFEAPIGSRMERAKDFWLFSYYINGLNMKDIAYLKWKNIDFEEGMVRFIRKKTEIANKSNQVKISAVLSPYAIEVIEKYCVLNRDPEEFIFPIISNSDTPEQVFTKTHDFTAGINKGLQQLKQKLNITKSFTTYSARHSHATILLQNGASLEQIMDQFKHSSMKVTMNYIDSITDQSRKDLSKLL